MERLMIVNAVDPETGRPIRMQCAAKSEDEIRDLLAFDLSEDSLKRKIDALSISADTKSVLFTIAKTTIRVGAVVLKIGRKVLDIIVTILGEFPMATTGAIFGAIFGYLVTSVPIIGMIFGPFVATLAIAFGFASGAIQDLANKALERRIMASVSSFESLKPKV
jgi:hypothetical protein